MSDLLKDAHGEYIEIGGVRRRLGKFRPLAGMLGSFPRFKDNVPLVPRSQWKEIDRRAEFGPQLIEDQNGFNDCTCEAAVVALAKSLVLMGHSTYTRLSPALPYSEINGGQDQGAFISHALEALKRGTCRFETHGRSPLFKHKIPAHAWAERTRFRVAEVYNAQTFDEIGSGLQLGFLAIYGIQVGRGFEQLSPNGVAPHFRGPGNHAMSSDGMKQIGGKWYLDNVNSWSPDFGDEGRCYLGEQHFAGIDPDCWLIRAAQEDPQNAPPPMV